MSLSHHPNIVRNGLVAYFDAANPKSYPAGQDPYVSGVNLLFDGESLVDKSAKTQSFTNNSSVTVSTNQKKFGNSSLYFSGRTADGGSNSYLSFAANSDRYLSGYVSIILAYNRALTAAEVLQNYNATKGRFR